MTKVLFIVGSLRQGSFNQQLAAQAEKILEGRADVSYLDWREVPVFSQELESPVLPAVQAVRDAVLAADAIWFFSPVYNANIPGSVKNLIDWLSRAVDLSDTTGASVLHGKMTTVSLVSAAHQELAAEQYRALLPFVRTNFVDQVTISGINSSAWADGVYIPTEEVLAELGKQADALLEATK